jgi:hypothetical protein
MAAQRYPNDFDGIFAKAPVPYNLLAPFENYLSRERFEITAKDFQGNAVISLLIPAEKEPDFRSFYLNLVNGKPNTRSASSNVAFAELKLS